MAFRFKDLMVDVLSAGGGGCPTLSVEAAGDQCPTLSVDPAQATCPTLSVDPAGIAAGGTLLCPTLTIPTPGYAVLAAATTYTIFCPTLTVPPDTLRGAGNLAALKQQLQQALEQIEARERAAQTGLPRTVEEADDLERRLREAIEELQEHKKTLRKPAAGATKAGRKGRK